MRTSSRQQPSSHPSIAQPLAIRSLARKPCRPSSVDPYTVRLCRLCSPAIARHEQITLP